MLAMRARTHTHMLAMLAHTHASHASLVRAMLVSGFGQGGKLGAGERGPPSSARTHSRHLIRSTSRPGYPSLVDSRNRFIKLRAGPARAQNARRGRRGGGTGQDGGRRGVRLRSRRARAWPARTRPGPATRAGPAPLSRGSSGWSGPARAVPLVGRWHPRTRRPRRAISRCVLSAPIRLSPASCEARACLCAGKSKFGPDLLKCAATHHVIRMHQPAKRHGDPG
jgi:hypothetical protein